MKPKLVDSQPFQLCSSELYESGRSQPPCLLGFLPCYTAMWKQISEAMSQKPCFASDVFPSHPAALCELWFWRMVNSHFAWNAHTHTQTDTQTQTYRQTHTQTDTHTHRILEPCVCNADLLPWEQKPYPQPLSALLAWRLSHLGKVTGFILSLGSCCSQQGNPS